MIFQNVWISCQQAVYMMDLQSCRKKCSKSYLHSEVYWRQYLSEKNTHKGYEENKINENLRL